jgi:hypothetical protein
MKKLTSPIKLIEESITLFKKKENFLALLRIYLPLAIFPVLSIAFSYLPIFTKNTNSVWFISLMTAVRVIYSLASVFVAISGIIAVSEIVGNGKPFFKKIYKKAWKGYWKFLLLNIVLGLLYLIGFVFLIIPGVLAVVWLTFSRFIMIEKQAGLRESLVHSRMLVKGYFWKILGRLIVFGIFSVLIEIFLEIIPFGIGTIIWTLCGALFILPQYLLYRELSE